ncbi:unnamed protein product, partial [marine sediment metagenome]
DDGLVVSGGNGHKAGKVYQRSVQVNKGAGGLWAD